MKKFDLIKVLVLLLILSVSAAFQLAHAQDGVGIDTPNPLEKLDVNGAVKIGTDFNNAATAPIGGAGTIRWNGTNFEGWDGTQWIQFGGTGTAGVLEDADTDTKVQVEESADEDLIRFDVAGTEYYRMHAGRIQVSNTGSSVSIGNNAGLNDDFSNNRNVAIGLNAGRFTSTGENNVAVGRDALRNNTTGSLNVALGNYALRNNTTANTNVALGHYAMYATTTGESNVAIGSAPLRFNTTGGWNYAIGNNALYRNVSGSNNIAIGRSAGYNVLGSGGVYIGNQAGSNETGSNKLYIDNTNTASPLIYGEFDNNLLRVNGTINVNNAYDLPTADGTSGYVMTTDGSGAVSWTDPSGLSTVLQDADTDTKIQVEESADDDIIRFDVAGTEHFRMEGHRLETANSGNGVFIGDNAGLNDALGNTKNIAIGRSALQTNVSGKQNVAIGDLALPNTVGDNNVAIGETVMQNHADGDGNTVVGKSGLHRNTSGANNTVLGLYAGYYNVNGDANVFLGHRAGQNEFGSNKLYIENSSTGDPLIYGEFDNDIVGLNADVGVGIESPDEALHVYRNGENAIVKIESPGSSHEARMEVHKFGSFSAGVGYYPGTASLRLRTNTNDAIVFEPNGAEKVRIANTGNVGIGVTNPQDELHVVGSLRMVDGNQQAGYVPVSDANGTMVWSDPNALFDDSDWTVNGNNMYSALSGNVGIGTNSPSYDLDIVKNEANVNQRVYSWDADGIAQTLVGANGGGHINVIANSSTSDYLGIPTATSGIATDYTDMVFATGSAGSATEKMRVTRNGNVGIGTDNPNTALHVVSSSTGGPAVRIETGSNQYASTLAIEPSTHATSNRATIELDNWGFVQDVTGNGTKDFSIYNNLTNSHAFSIETNNNVGIGTHNPEEKLEVQGTIRMVDGNQTAGYIPVSDADGSMTWTDPTTVSTAVDDDWTVSGSNQYSAVSGNVGIGVATPLEKLHVADGEVLFDRHTDGSNTINALTIAGKLEGNVYPYASINFQNYDGIGGSSVDYVGASIRSHNGGATDDGDLRFYTASNQTLTQAMTIDYTGNVGIGDNTPDVALDVSGQIQMETGAAAGYIPVSDANGTMTWTAPSAISGINDLADGDDDTKIQVEESADEDQIRFDIEGTEAMILSDEGKLGLGTSSPDQYIDVNLSSGGDGAFGQFKSTNTNGFAGVMIDRYTTSDNGYIIHKTNGSSQWYVGQMTDDTDYEISRSAGGDATFHIEDSNGHVGVGTSDPTAEMHVSASDGQTLMLTREDASITSGEQLGGIGFDGADGNIPDDIRESSAAIIAFATETHGTGDKGGRLSFWTSPNNQNDDTDGLERLRIDQNGIHYVGADMYWRDNDVSGTNIARIVDDGDDGQLVIYENGSNQIVLDANGTSVFNEQGFDRNFRVESDGQSNMLFVDAGNNRIGIRSGSPEGDLFISQSSASTSGNGGVYLDWNGDHWKTFHSGLHYSFANEGTRYAYVEDNTGNYVQPSDENLKTNIKEVSDVLAGVKELNPVTYTYKSSSDPSSLTYGFLAQEVAEIFPDVVRYTEDGTPALAYDMFGILSIKAIQEQQALIEGLKAENAELKAANAATTVRLELIEQQLGIGPKGQK